MAVTVSAFKISFPDFENSGDDLIEACLEEAARRIPAANWRTKTNDGIGYLAAHLIALRTLGQPARLQGADISDTTYGREYLRLMRSVSYGGRVAG